LRSWHAALRKLGWHSSLLRALLVPWLVVLRVLYVLIFQGSIAQC
jgi:hypothetical protein